MEWSRRLVVALLAVLTLDCRRERREEPTAAVPSALSPAPSASQEPLPRPTLPVRWSGKRLHYWVTSCDASSREAKDVLARAAKAAQGLGVVCTTLDREGGLVFPPSRASMAARVAKMGATPSLVVANPGPLGFDGPLAVQVVSDPARRARLVDAIAQAVKKEGYRAVELDLEAMATTASASFVDLAREVIARVGPDVEVVVDAHPKTVDDPGWDGPGSHDYRALSDVGAVIRLMTYDLSIGPVPPGPSTKASWIRDVVTYARKKGVPPHRLEIGLPAYGYDFPPKGKGPAMPLRHEDVVALRAKKKAELLRDENGTPHFSYEASDGTHEVWFDDATSLARLLNDLLAVAGDVRGIAVWGIGRADPELDRIFVEAGFRPRQGG